MAFGTTKGWCAGAPRWVLTAGATDAACEPLLTAGP